MSAQTKTVRWSVSSRTELRALPKEVRRIIGHALWEVQSGMRPLDAKVLRGFGGGGVLEIRADHGGNAYRAVYTVRLGEAVYVLLVFQKKSKKGIKTPADIMDLIRKRLKAAEKDYEAQKKRDENTDSV